MSSKHLPTTKQQRERLVKTASRALFWFSITLLIYMPFHVFLSQSLSLWTGGLDQWKIAKDVLVFGFAATATSMLMIRALRRREKWLTNLLVVTAAYGLLHLLFLLFKDLDTESSLLATVYNNRLSMILLIGLFVGLYLPKHYQKGLYWRVLVGTSVVVAVLGLVQFVLPGDFLEDLGYSFERGARAFFGIDNKQNLPRIMSTIRDPNTLGSYLLVSLSLLWGLWLRNKQGGRRNWLTAAIGLQLVAVVLTFSRSAWLGVALSAALIAWQAPQIRKYMTLKNVGISAGVLVLLSIVFMPTIRDSYVLENIIFHSDETTSDLVLDSNEKHLDYVIDTAGDIVDEPLGHGPGTAGIVSIRNERGTVLPENYYLQIGYEVGVLGLALFLALNILVYQELHKTKASVYRTALLASFWGLVVTNMLLHIWTNEAVATVWWLSAGYHIGASRGG